LLAFFKTLAAHPDAGGSHRRRDEIGHVIEFHLVAGLWIGSWTDHAVREVRVCQIDSASTPS
jgi:hypothetical protein